MMSSILPPSSAYQFGVKRADQMDQAVFPGPKLAYKQWMTAGSCTNSGQYG